MVEVKGHIRVYFMEAGEDIRQHVLAGYAAGGYLQEALDLALVFLQIEQGMLPLVEDLDGG